MGGKFLSATAVFPHLFAPNLIYLAFAESISILFSCNALCVQLNILCYFLDFLLNLGVTAWHAKVWSSAH